MSELFFPPRRPIGWEHRYPLTSEEQAEHEESARRAKEYIENPPIPRKSTEYPRACDNIGWEHRNELTPAERELEEYNDEQRLYRATPSEIAYSRGTRKLLLSDRYILRTALKEKSNTVNLGVVLNGYQNRRENKTKTRNALYQEIYRGFSRLEVHGLGTLGKMDGLVIFTVDRRAVLTLIQWNTKRGSTKETLLDKGFKQNSNSDENQQKYDYLATENITNSRRQSAVNYLQGIKWIERYDRNYLNNLFLSYDADVKDKVIALLSDEGEIYGMQYSTRFNDTRKSAISLKKYDYAIDKSYDLFYKAIYVTLTTSPNDHNHIWESNRNFSLYWNKFMSALTKRFGKRPAYISAFEFAPKKGLMHCHALIFVPEFITLASTEGMTYKKAVRKRKEELSSMWQRISNAFIVDYQEVERKKTRSGGLAWSWRDPNPRDTRGKPIKESVTDYLKKYMKKSILAVNEENLTERADTQSLYWAFNKRFWTCSRIFNPEPEEEEQMSEDKPRYVFLGVFYDVVAFDIVDYMIYWRGGENPNIDYDARKAEKENG